MVLTNILQNYKNHNFNKIIINEQMGVPIIMLGESPCMYIYIYILYENENFSRVRSVAPETLKLLMNLS